MGYDFKYGLPVEKSSSTKDRESQRAPLDLPSAIPHRHPPSSRSAPLTHHPRSAGRPRSSPDAHVQIDRLWRPPSLVLKTPRHAAKPRSPAGTRVNECMSPSSSRYLINKLAWGSEHPRSLTLRNTSGTQYPKHQIPRHSLRSVANVKHVCITSLSG